MFALVTLLSLVAGAEGALVVSTSDAPRASDGDDTAAPLPDATAPASDGAAASPPRPVAAPTDGNAAPASLRVATDPPGAAVTIDGVLAGISPQELQLAAGVHTITVEQGSLVTTHTFELAAGAHRTLTLRLVAPTSRPFPKEGVLTFAGGALALTGGLLLRFPAEDAAREVSGYFARGGGWDARAAEVEAAGLRAQTMSWLLVGAGAAMMASGIVVSALQLFLPNSPVLSVAPTREGALLSWSARW